MVQLEATIWNHYMYRGKFRINHPQISKAQDRLWLNPNV